MTAKIVTDKGLGPQIGSMILAGGEVSTPVTFSNLDNSGVAGWRWEVVDAPADSPTLNPLPAPVYTNTAIYANDVKGHSVLVRLTTYLDVARTILDDVDQVVLGVRFDAPFDWLIPAAGQTIEANAIRGWAADVNRMLRETHVFIDGGGGGGGGVDYKSSVRFATTEPIPAYSRIGNIITAFASGAFPTTDGVIPVQGDSLLLRNGPYGALADADAGIYEITQLGDGGSPFILTRRDDADQDSLVTSGLRVPVEEGNTLAGLMFVLVTPNPIVLNTTNLFFAKYLPGAIFEPFWHASGAAGEYQGFDFVNTSPFVALVGKTNKWSGSSVGVIATLPPITDDMHNKIIAFVEDVGSNANGLTITADAGDYIYENVAGLPSLGNSITVKGARSYIALRCDVSSSGWKIIAEKLPIANLPAATPAAGDAFVFEDASDLNRKKTAALSAIAGLGAPAAHVHDASEITTGTLADARVAESNVTQHQAALAITEAQITDLNHTDADAFHASVSNEFTPLPLEANFSQSVAVIYEGATGAKERSTPLGMFSIIDGYRVSGHMRGNGTTAQISTTGTVNNYTLTAFNRSWLAEFSTAGSGLIMTGVQAPSVVTQESFERILFNRRTFDVTLQHENVGSLAANRFLSLKATDYILKPGEACKIVYYTTASRWVIFPLTLDPSAFHSDVAGEFLALPNPGAATAADLLTIEEFNASYAKRKISLGSVAGYGPPQAHSHDASAITSGTFADARVAESNVTQHQAALAITESQITDLDHTDANAIHGNVAGEIAALTTVTVDAADYLLIEDASDSNNKKKVLASDLLGAGTDVNAIHNNVAGEITAIAAKTAPVAADTFVIEDSEAADAKKSLQYGDVVATALNAITVSGGDVVTSGGNVVFSL